MSTSLSGGTSAARRGAPEAIQSNGLRRVSAPRHLPVEVQHAALTRRLVGHFNYFVNGNHRSGPSGSRHATGLAWLRRRPAHASHVGGFNHGYSALVPVLVRAGDSTLYNRGIRARLL